MIAIFAFILGVCIGAGLLIAAQSETSDKILDELDRYYTEEVDDGSDYRF